MRRFFMVTDLVNKAEFLPDDAETYDLIVKHRKEKQHGIKQPPQTKSSAVMT